MTAPQFYHSQNGRFSLAHLWLKYPEFAGGSVGATAPAIPSVEVSPTASFEFAAPVPVLGDNYGLHTQVAPAAFGSMAWNPRGEAREGNTPFGGDTGNTMPDSCGGRGNRIGRWDR